MNKPAEFGGRFPRPCSKPQILDSVAPAEIPKGFLPAAATAISAIPIRGGIPRVA